MARNVAPTGRSVTPENNNAASADRTASRSAMLNQSRGGVEWGNASKGAVATSSQFPTKPLNPRAAAVRAAAAGLRSGGAPGQSRTAGNSQNSTVPKRYVVQQPAAKGKSL